jgi:hypothetical protein
MTAAEPWHGTVNGYNYHGCRCAECRATMNEFLRNWRAENRRRPVPGWVRHGSASTARNYGCKCDSCRDAVSDENRASRQRRKAAK